MSRDSHATVNTMLVSHPAGGLRGRSWDEVEDLYV